ncbi:MAG: type II secretion system F family protein [Planctomycetes bacterium]|nr:type II secretion system F family protein [Planctomycetota bacterium]
MAKLTNVPEKSSDDLIGLLKEQTRFGPDQPRTRSERLDHFFDELIEQSGLEVAPGLALAAIASIGMIMAGAMFVWEENVVAAAIGLAAGVGLSVLFLQFLRKWRFGQIKKQLPDAIEAVSRSVRAGRSLEQSIEDASREVPAPLGDELKRVSLRLGLGLSVAGAVREMPRRLPLAGVQIFAAALALHQQTGGNLIHALEQLSRTIRERTEFQGFLLAVGPGVLTVYSLRQPNFLPTLTGTATGIALLTAAAMLQLIGSIWVLALFRSSLGPSKD